MKNYYTIVEFGCEVHRFRSGRTEEKLCCWHVEAVADGNEERRRISLEAGLCGDAE